MSQDQLFSGIDRRIALDREEGDIAYFNALMLKLEYLTKVIVAGVVACISDDVDRHRYTLEHKLVARRFPRELDRSTEYGPSWTARAIACLRSAGYCKGSDSGRWPIRLALPRHK